MSKTKNNKDKKQNNSADQQLIELQKRQILELTFSMKKLQDRLSRMAEQNHQVTSTRDKFQQEYEQRIDKQRIIIESHQNNIKENRSKIYDLDVAKMTLESRVKDMDRELRQLQASKNRELQQYRRVTQNEIGKLESQLKQYNIYMSERDQMSHQNNSLKKNVETQKEVRIREVADKEREKVQAIDRLRDEMLTKIKDMRSNLLSLKKEQLDTTTRLAVLQNHQLTSQLQFQSKQSEKLIFENEQLIKKVSHLQKDLQIHQQIQQQLAKRSHYSRGIIKKLTAKIADLEENIKQLNQKLEEKKTSQPNKSIADEIKKEEVIKTLDRSLQNSEKKYIKLLTEAQLAKNQLMLVKTKVQQYQKRGNSVLDILFKYYGEFEEGNLSATEGGYQIDLSNLRKKKVEEWSKQQLRLVIGSLLQQAASFLNRKSLNLPAPFRPDETSVLDSDEGVNNIRLPKISEHSMNSKLELSMKLKQLPISMGSKLVGSQVRDWGRTVHSSSHVNLVRRYKVYEK